MSYQILRVFEYGTKLTTRFWSTRNYKKKKSATCNTSSTRHCSEVACRSVDLHCNIII
jgi:hypothetical protein